MISSFPTPFPEELFYSLCARFSHRMGYANLKDVPSQLFGCTSALAVVDLPSHLGYFVGQLPQGHSLRSLDRLIAEHTLFPYFRVFRASKHIEQVWTAMAESGPVHGLLGLMANRVKTISHLRYCPLCVREDRERIGEAYWRRSHQAPGVNVCPHHRVFLRDSVVRIRDRQTRHAFWRAEDVLETRTIIPVRVDPGNPEHRRLLRLAEDTLALLRGNLPPKTPDLLGSMYRRWAAEKALASHSGRIRVRALTTGFVRFYGSDLLERLSCPVNLKSSDPWPVRLMRQPEVGQHPLHHLLLLQFLDMHVEDLETGPPGGWFGVGPWPCLNPVCSHYRANVISDYSPGFTSDRGRPVATFTCTCGFSYRRAGPDQCPGDLSRFDRIVALGPVWQGELRRLWLDPGVSLRGLAGRLGVDPKTARSHATELGLPPNRPGARVDSSPRCPPPRSAPLPPTLEQEIEQKRTAWLGLKEANPGAGAKLLRSLAPALYAWLYRHSRVWLLEQAPPRGRPKDVSRVDWGERDARISRLIPGAVQRLRRSAGRPARLTSAAIAREAGELSTIRRHLNKLPRTAKILRESTETRVDFALRRIEWACRTLRAQGRTAKGWEIARESGLRSDLLNHPTVRAAVEGAEQALRLDWLRLGRTVV